MILGSRIIRFVRIFAWVLYTEGAEYQWEFSKTEVLGQDLSFEISDSKDHIGIQ